MKKIYFLLISLLFVSSCKESWVDTKPSGLPTTAYFWQSEEDVNKAVAAMYTPFRYESTFGRDLYWIQVASDDLIVGRSKAVAENIKNFIPDGREGYMTTAWSDLYWMMDKANQVLANIDHATNVTDAVKKRAKGEAYFIRGFSHFWIAYIWGRVDQGVPFDGPENAEYQKRIPPQLASVKDNYAQIVADMQKAADMLPLFETYTSADYGRAHKVAALGYMVKAYAYWATYDASKWSLIPDICDKIKNEGGRALVKISGNPKESYRQVFSVTKNWSSEYIWSATSGTQGGSEFPGVVLENKGWGKYNGWGYFQPTEELYDEYEANDPRREVTILKFNDDFTFFGEARKYFSTNSLSGFQINKYMEPYSYGTGGNAGTDPYINQNGDYPTTSLNLPLMRYAEILLFKAEALLMLNRASEASAPLNEIRNRVGLASIATPTMSDLKHERRCELACEWTDRLQDLKRWGDYSKITMALHGRSHSDKTNPASPYTIIQVWAQRTFNPAKAIVWPYNPDEISRSNGAYKQNAGW
jgi:starch-binding outer membrane protein, SusD/RagB family